MKIKIGQVINRQTQERVICGELEFKFSEEQPNIKYLDEEEILTSTDTKLYFSATYEVSSSNVSVFVREDENHIFTGIFNWSYPATCFAFVTKEEIFTELFFEK